MFWQIEVGRTVETVRFFHCYKRGVDRVFVDHPYFLEKVGIVFLLCVENFPCIGVDL